MVDDNTVAEHLLKKKYYLSALELHQELLEGNNGVHNVAALNKFFGDSNNYSTLMKQVETDSITNKKNAIGMGTSSVQSPFADDGLQSALAARDQRIALLEFKLRCAENDLLTTKTQLEDAINNTSNTTPNMTPKLTNNNSTNSSSTSSNNNSKNPLLGSDEDGKAITEREKNTINALVKRYLLSRGYKSTVIALIEEIGNRDDTDLIALPGHRRGNSRGGGSTGAGVPVLSLLSMHRDRIAPIQVLKENEDKHDGEILRLRAELDAAHNAVNAASEQLAGANARIAQLERDLLHANTVVGNANKAATATSTTSPTNTAAVPTPAVVAPVTVVPPAPVSTSSSTAGTISMAHAPALLRVLSEGIPILSRVTVTKERSALIPLLSHAAAADGVTESRRGLIQSMLMLLRRPCSAERHLLKIQISSLANKLGTTLAEQDIMPEVILLAKTGKTKERKALAAMLCGSLAAYVSDKRCDGLLGVLADLAESKHAIVRVGVVDGLTAVVNTLSDRWKKCLDSGIQPGNGSQLEAFSQRQFAQVEELMWRCLLGTNDENDNTDLTNAVSYEHLPSIPSSYAMIGTPEGDAYNQITNSSGTSSTKSGYGNKPIDTRPLPSSWSTIPNSVSAAVCNQLVPVLVVWSYRLGSLWTKLIPQILGMLMDTLSSKSPSDALPASARATTVTSVTTNLQATATEIHGRTIAALRPTEWHARRLRLILQALGAAGVRLRQCVFDEGYSITYLAPPESSTPAPAPAPTPSTETATTGESGTTPATTATPQAALNPQTDFLYELFDFCSGANVKDFPTELALPAFVRGGQVQYPNGVNSATYTAALMPTQQRQALVLAALLRGTTAVRRRRNIAINPATLQPGQAVWQPVRDEMISLSWPSLKFVLRNLTPVLIHQAACVNRASTAGRSIVDAYAECLNQLCTAFGPAFTAYGVRPMFLRGLGIPSDLPPPSAAPLIASASTSGNNALNQAIALATPGPGGRNPSLMLFAQLLYGVPSSPADARKAAQAAAMGNFAAPINFASAGPKGSDWPLVMPELSWFCKDSPENPSSWVPTSNSSKTGANAQPTATANPGTTDGPAAALALAIANSGGVWNSDALLPMFGTGVLASSSLQPRELLEHALRSLIILVATNVKGWGMATTALEDCVMRAGGGNSTTGSVSATAKSQAALTISDMTNNNTNTNTPAVVSSNAQTGILQYILTEVLQRMSSNSDPAIRVTVGGLFRSLIPLLSPALLQDPFLTTIRKLSTDDKPTVVRSAVRALATVYSTGASNDDSVRELVNTEITNLLASGPKDVILEILRALMRAVPNAAPTLRDGFILDRLLEITERIYTAAEAGAQAMRELCATIGDIDPGDVHNAATGAARATRAAAIQANEPWPGARAEDLEDVVMALCEDFRAFGSCLLSGEVKALVRQATGKLLRTDLLDPSYRDTMRTAFAAIFPEEAPPPVTMDSLMHGNSTHGEMEYGGIGYDNNTSQEILEQFATEREEGILPPSMSLAGVNSYGQYNHPEENRNNNSLMGVSTAKAMSSIMGSMKGINLKGAFSGAAHGLAGSSFGFSNMNEGIGSSSNNITGVTRPMPNTPSTNTETNTARRNSYTNQNEAPTMSMSAFALGPPPTHPPSNTSTSGTTNTGGGGGSRRNSATEPAFSMSAFTSGTTTATTGGSTSNATTATNTAGLPSPMHSNSSSGNMGGINMGKWMKGVGKLLE